GSTRWREGAEDRRLLLRTLRREGAREGGGRDPGVPERPQGLRDAPQRAGQQEL
ncbi:MAG: hypothetical protein AVDCRST_MAG16-2048, partial [uncultured Frankineae bacterium]